MRHDESFHPSLLLFLFDWWMKWWQFTEDIDELQWLVLITSCYMAKCKCTDMIASSIKISSKCNVFAMYQFKSAKMLGFICVFFGCDSPNTYTFMESFPTILHFYTTLSPTLLWNLFQLYSSGFSLCLPCLLGFYINNIAERIFLYVLLECLRCEHWGMISV